MVWETPLDALTSVQDYQRFYQIDTVNLRFSGRDYASLSKLDHLLKRVLVLTECDYAQATSAIKLLDKPFSKPNGDLVYSAGSLAVLKTKTGFYLSCGASQLTLDTQTLRATAYLSDYFWHESLYAQREFIMLSILMLLRPQGLYGLHACGLKKHNTGLLVVGSSGSGKTTTTLNLINSAWQFLSDDAVLLKASSTNVEALAFRKGFSVMPDVFQAFNDKDASLEFDDPEGKKVINLNPEFAAGFTATCTPNIILFPRLGLSTKTSLAEINTTQALILLAQQSAGIMTDANTSKAQLHVLSHMLKQAKTYELLLAPDALENPSLVSMLVEAKLHD